MSETSRPKKKGEEVNLKQSGNGWAYDSGRNAGIDEVDKYLSDKVVLKREALSCESLEKVCQKILADAVVNNELTSDGFAKGIIKYIEDNKL